MAKQRSYLHARLVEGLLGDALALSGNRAGLEQLRRQIERALEDVDGYPFHEALYLDADGEEFEVFIRLASSRAEMREQAKRPKPQKTSEALPWSEKARGSQEGREANR